VRASSVALLKEQIMAQVREIAELQIKLARHDDGSLFDLKHDKADDLCLPSSATSVWPRPLPTASQLGSKPSRSMRAEES
jgi:hypothetical protein